MLKSLIRWRHLRLIFNAFLHISVHAISSSGSTLSCSTALMEYMQPGGQIWRLENKDRTSILAKLESLLFDACSEIFFLLVLTGTLPLLFFTLLLPAKMPPVLHGTAQMLFLLWNLSWFPNQMWTFHPLKPQGIQGILTHLDVYVWVFYVITILRQKIPEGRTCALC